MKRPGKTGRVPSAIHRSAFRSGAGRHKTATDYTRKHKHPKRQQGAGMDMKTAQEGKQWQAPGWAELYKISGGLEDERVRTAARLPLLDKHIAILDHLRVTSLNDSTALAEVRESLKQERTRAEGRIVDLDRDLQNIRELLDMKNRAGSGALGCPD